MVEKNMDKELLIKIIDFLPEPTFAIDGKKRIIACNSAIEKLFGIKRDKILGKSCREYALLTYGVDRPLFLELILEENEEIKKLYDNIVKKDDVIYGETYVPSMNNGNGAYIMVMAAPIRDENNEIRGAIETIRDITERKRIEEALKKSEEKFRNIYENAIEGMYQTTPDGRFLNLNPALAKMFGYESPQEMIDAISNIAEQLYVNPEDRKRFIEQIEREGFVKNFEVNLYKRDGSKFWVSLNANKKREKEQYTVYYEGFVIDITDRKQAEAKLKDEIRFTRSLLDNSPAYYVALSKDYRIMYMNKFLLASLGYTDEEVLGKDYVSNFVPEEERDYAFHIFERIVKNKERPVDEIHILTKDGKKRLVQWHGMPVLNREGEVEYFIGVGIDITERKQAEKRLEEEKRRFFLLAENAPFGLALFDHAGRFSYVNPKFKEIFGYDMDETPDGRTWCRKVYPDPEYRHRVIATWLNDVERFRENPLIREGKQWTFTVTCKDNSKKVINFIPVRLPTGNYLMTYEDITEVKRLQAQLLHSQKMEAIGSFVGGVAHDFNNILTAILGYAGLAFMKMDNQERLSQYLKQIINASEKATELIKKLLSFARKQDITLQTWDLNEIIEQNTGLFKRILREDIELQLNLYENKLFINADKIQIEQVMMNLLANARDAMPDGGTITIKTSQVEMDKKFIETRGFGKPGRYALLMVEDTGTGIDENLKDKIFEPFFTTKDVNKGTGLGLSIVYGIVKQHNGFIDFDSKLGAGTVFYIYLPLMGMEVYKRELNAEFEIKRGNETILLTEDDEMVRTYEKNILEENGYRVIEAINGLDALDKFNLYEKDIDLVILDVVMPGKNGREVYEEIKGKNPSIPVLFLSGYTFDIIQQKGIDLTKIEILPKPIVYSTFLKKIREILDKKYSKD